MFTGVMVEDNNIYWNIYSIIMLSIFAVMKITATTKRIIEKIKEYQNHQIINIQLNPETAAGHHEGTSPPSSNSNLTIKNITILSSMINKSALLQSLPF